MTRAIDPRLQRERAIYAYLDALERGDPDALTRILHQAVYDSALDHLLVEAHLEFFRAETPLQSAQAGGPGLEPATLPSRRPLPGPRRRGMRWPQALAAMVLIGVVLGSLVALLAARRTLGPVHPAALTCTPGAWSVASDAHQPGGLGAVAAISPTDAWAVGTLTLPDGSSAGLIEHWDGRRWTVALATAGRAQLHAVAALASNDVWAVGEQSEHGPATTLIEHWDGRRWMVVPSPNALPVSGAHNELGAITAISASDIWAVGAVRGPAAARWTLLEHWDGRHWHLVPDQGRQFQPGELLSVTAVSASNVWAAGDAPIRGGRSQREHCSSTGMASTGTR